MSSTSARDQLLPRLLRFGEPSFPKEGSYIKRCDISPTDVAALLDWIPLWPDDEWFAEHRDTPTSWAPLHAWRALAELGAVEVIEALIAILDDCDRGKDSVFLEEFPAVWLELGAASIEPLARFLLETEHLEYARVCAAHGLRDVGRELPAHRDAAVNALAGALEGADASASQFNGFVISYLGDLQAVEHAELIKRTFAAGLVAEMVCGGWADVAYKLGIGPRPPGRQPVDAWSQPMSLPSFNTQLPTGLGGDANRPSATRGRSARTDKEKAKRKRARAARKKNRRR